MNPLDARQAHRTLGLGLILGIAALLLWTSNAAAGQFTPPTPRQAQRILGNAFDARLRPRFPRSGITTRCRGNRRYLLCSVHVWRRDEHLFWTIVEVRIENGRVRTSLTPALDGCVAIPAKTLSYRSRPLEAS